MRAQTPAFRLQCEQLEARDVPAFGVGGFVSTDLAHTTGEVARDVDLQSDGKIVVAGGAGIVRYNTDGSLDTTFNAGGAQPGVVPVTGNLFDVVIQPDGKIVGAGHAIVTNKQLALLLRFNADGTPDTTFGTNGAFTTDFKKGPDSDNLRKIALQPDGKIVAAALINGTQWGVARFNANGGLDTSFDRDGWLTTDFGTGYPPSARSIAVQSDGRIVVGGDVYVSTQRQRDVAVVRYLSNGALDTSFGGTGKVLVDFAAEYPPGGRPTENLYALAIQSDGRIVFAGDGQGPTVRPGTHPLHGKLGRLNSDGSLDSSFGGNGLVLVYSPAYSHPTQGTIYPAISFVDLAIQADGKIVAYSPWHSSNDFPSAVVRVNADGTLDTSFGGDGVEYFVWPDGYQDGTDYAGVVVQPDGKVIVASYHFGATSNYFALARFNADGTLDV